MSFEEKNQWAYGVVVFVAFTTYVVIILSRAQSVPLTEVPYQWTMVGTIVAAIIASILATIAISISSPKEAGKKDERDREINRRGEYIGQSFAAIGGLAAMIMAMLEVDYFWIANGVYLFFALSALLGTTAKLVAYRRGFQSW